MTETSTQIQNLVIIHPVDAGLEEADVLTLVNELERIVTPKESTSINLLLNSSGGDIYAAYKMVHILRSKCNHLRVIVPFYAKSAATLMALGADEIIMAPQSELGPLDAPMEHPLQEGIQLSALDGVRPLEFLSDFCNTLATEQLGVKLRQLVQLGRKDSLELSLRFAAEFVNPIVGKLDPLLINMCYRRLQIAERYGNELLTEFMFVHEPNKNELAESTLRELVWMYPEHGYAICCSEAKRIHLNVIKAEYFPEWNNFWRLWKDLDREKRKIIQLIPQSTLEGRPSENHRDDVNG